MTQYKNITCNAYTHNQLTKYIYKCINIVLFVVLIHSLISLPYTGILFLKSCRQPVKTFVQTITSSGTASLDIPWSMSKAMQAQFIGHFSGRHGIRKILFVGKNEENGFFQFILIEHSMKFVPGSINTISIVWINNENQPLCILIVVSPQRSNLILTSYIPHGETNILHTRPSHNKSNKKGTTNGCKEWWGI